MNASPGRARPVEATPRRILAISAPMMLAHMTEPLLGLVDAAVIGRLGSVPLLGAVAVGAIIFDILFWGLGSLRLSTAALTAQAHGAGDDRETRRAIARALTLALGLGLALIALQVPIMAVAFRLMEASPAVSDAARAYVSVRIWSAPFALANYAILGSLIGRARTGLGLGLQVVINLTKIGFTLVAVPLLHLGLPGAAGATVAAEIVGTLAGLAVLCRAGGLPLDVSRREILRPEALRRMLLVNRDVAIRSITLLVAFAFFTAQGARAGDLTLAANAVLYNIFLFGSYFLDGFATAAEQLCGQALGARDETGFRTVVRLVLVMSIATGFGVFLAVRLGGGAFVDLVSTSAEVRDAARAFLPYAALAPFIGAAAFAFDGIYVGATWTRWMRNLMLISFALYLGTFYLGSGWSNAGLWTAFLTFLGARGFGQAVLYPRLAARSFPPAAVTARR